MVTAAILATKTPQATPAGSTRSEGGQPVRRFTKELIRCGQYVKESDNLRFEVTPKTLQHWVDTCGAFLSAGNRIPVPATHTDDPEANRGWVVDIFAEGDSLFATIDLVGNDGIKLAGTCDTSIYCPAEFVDGKGNHYIRPILHVALCTDPVVPGLGGFIPISTSHGSVSVPIYTLQLGGAKMPQSVPMDPMNPQPSQTPEEPPPEKKPITLSPAEAVDESVKQELQGLFQKVVDGQTTVQDCLKEIGALMKKYDKIHKLLEPDEPDETRAEEEGGAAEDTGETPPAEMAMTPPEEEEKKGVAASRKPDPMLVRLAAENYGMKIDNLVASRKISPAAAKKLKGQFFGTNNQSLALSLSRSTNGVTELDGVLLALADNTPLPVIGEQTGPQAPLVLSSPLSSQPDKGTQEKIEQMWSMLPGSPKPAA